MRLPGRPLYNFGTKKNHSSITSYHIDAIPALFKTIIEMNNTLLLLFKLLKERALNKAVQTLLSVDGLEGVYKTGCQRS